MDTIQKGTAAEYRFVSDALKRGFVVAMPVCHTEAFDVLVIHGQRVVKIQVKSASIKKADSRWNQPAYTCRTMRNTHKGYVPYKKGDYDFLALWTDEGWFLVPQNANKRSLCFAIHRKATSPWNAWLEAWHLLMEK